jgi:NitT/TauT family transport system substrate-binding protein
MRRLLIALVAAAIAASPARADDALRVGKSPGYLFAYVPLDVGIKEGFFAARHLKIETISFEGAAKMDQGMTAGALDIQLGSPMNMATMAKGMPSVAIAVIAQPMREFAVLVPYDSPARTLDDLKGKTIGIATVGSITEWCALELGKVKGWGPVHTVSIGSGNASASAALKTHLIDASIGNTMSGVVFERAHVARRLAAVSDYAPPFIAHVMSASRAIVAKNPDAVRNFVAAWFQSVAFMRDHKDEAIKIASGTTGLSPEDERTEYDLLMPELRAHGRFDPEAVANMAQSFVELGILDQPPDMAKLYTEAFLPR